MEVHALGIDLGEPDQAVRVGKGDRPEDDGVEDAEDRGARPDACAQGDHQGDREDGTTRERGVGVLEVASDGAPGGETPNVWKSPRGIGMRVVKPRGQVPYGDPQRAQPIPPGGVPVRTLLRGFLVLLPQIAEEALSSRRVRDDQAQ